jgi:hypothetical protein
MRKLGIIGAAGVVVVLCAIVTPSASALSLCLKVDVAATGTYEEAKCAREEAEGEYVLAVPVKKASTDVWCAKLDNASKVGDFETSECKTETPGKGAYDLVKLTKAEAEEQEEKEKGIRNPEFSPTGATVSLAGGTVKMTVENVPIVCSTTSAGGKIASATTVGGLIMKLTGCVATAGSERCTIKTVGASEGEISLRTLKGTLGTVKLTESSTEVGLLLEAETEKTMTEFLGNSCIKESFMTGSIAGEVLPVEVDQKTGKLVFGVSSGKQDITRISTSSRVVEPELHAFSEPVTEEFSDSLTYSVGTEVT